MIWYIIFLLMASVRLLECANIIIVPETDCYFEGGCKGKGWNLGDWKVRRGPTPSRNTGPRKDKTSDFYPFIARGYYAYYEATGKLEGDTATLLSREYTAHQCMTFYYFMYGKYMGSLDVKINDKTLFTKSGGQGFTWQKAKIDVWNNGHPYKVAFIATRGENYLSDIAIDHVTMEAGTCEAPTNLPEPITLPDGVYTCDFEQPITEVWKSDRFVGTSGETIVKGTGPNGDANFGPGKEGHYIYFISGLNPLVGTTATFSTVQLKAATICLDFAYNNYGVDGLSELKVIVNYGTSFDENDYKNKVMFEVKTEDDEYFGWRRKQITIDVTQPFRIAFIVKKLKKGVRGDIALDDIKLQEGTCAASGDVIADEQFVNVLAGLNNIKDELVTLDEEFHKEEMEN